jgi:3-dehydroquinate synthase
MARTIIVGKTPFKYNVLIAKNALTKANLLGHLKTKNKVFIITDSGVPKKYLDEVKEILKNKKKCYVHILEQGEKSKSFSSYVTIQEKLADLKFDRSDCMIALGGGVVGDVTGFCAATFLRGIDFIQIPTTLLSQVDSSVGGKTAINIKQGKNLIGSFNNPSLVLISSKFIETLTEREFNSGLGEVIKYAFIGNKKLYKLIKENSEAIKNRQLNILEDIIEESIKTKAKIVTEDEKESGIRAILNFGHTFGHAIEAFNKYKNITHGEAVTIGMIIAAKISFYEGHIKNYQLDNVVNLIDSLGLNSEYKKYKYENLKKFILNDKKVSEGKLNLILINSSGKAFKTNKFNPKNLQKAFI